MSGTILITGATSGIGFELAKQFAQEGRKVLALGRNKERLAIIGALSPHISAEAFELNNIDSLEKTMIGLFKRYPDISMIINNAGIQDNLRVDDASYSSEMIQREISINLTAPIEICRIALPHLKAVQDARIVNITSGLAFVPKLTSAVYSATKAGLHLFSDGLRVQSGEDVAVSEVILPIVATPMTQGRGSGKISAEEAAKQIIAGIKGNKNHIYVGKTKILPHLLRFAPFIARR